MSQKKRNRQNRDQSSEATGDKTGQDQAGKTGTTSQTTPHHGSDGRTGQPTDGQAKTSQSKSDNNHKTTGKRASGHNFPESPKEQTTDKGSKSHQGERAAKTSRTSSQTGSPNKADSDSRGSGTSQAQKASPPQKSTVSGKAVPDKKSRKAETGAGNNATSGPGRGSQPGSGGTGNGGRKLPLAIIIAVIALIIAVLAILSSAYLGFKSHQDQQRLGELDSRIDSVQSDSSDSTTDISDRLDELGERTDELAQDNEQLSDSLKDRDGRIDDLEDTLEHLQVRQKQLSDQLGGNNEQFVQQRIALLLEAANQRMQVAHDPDGAAKALKLADEAIKRNGNPELRLVREKIADELGEIKALPDTDTEGAALELAKLIRTVDQLPLNNDVPDSYEPRSGDSNSDQEDQDSPDDDNKSLTDRVAGLSDAVRRGLSRVVTVRRANGTDEAPELMAPDQSWFLSQNLGLQLRMARQALINGNAQTYQDSLSDARDWIKRYFDQDDSRVSAAMDQLKELEKLEIDWEAPDLSGSVKELRHIMERNGQLEEAGDDSPENDDEPSEALDEGDSDEDESEDDASDESSRDDKADNSEDEKTSDENEESDSTEKQENTADHASDSMDGADDSADDSDAVDEEDDSERDSDDNDDDSPSESEAEEGGRA